MRKFIYFLIFLGLGYLGYVIWQDVEKKRTPPPVEVPPTPVPTPTPAPTPTPTPEPEARYAPEGVLFVVKRFSEMHDGGVRGFSEGMEVRLLRQEAGYNVVTDGVVEARRPRTWFTRDIALARDLRERRLTDQAELQKRLEDERALFEKRENERVSLRSAMLERIDARRREAGTRAAAAAPASSGLAPLRLGSWNIEFFGNRNDPPRTAEDVQAIADHIRSLDVQVLAVCEIDGAKPLQELCGRLGPGWKFVIGTSGLLGEQGQIAPGVLWDDARVELVNAGELSELRQGNLFHRVPVTAAFRCRAGGPDFRVISVHLKAGRQPEDFERRRGELSALRAYLGKLTADPDEDNDVVVLGDFNHCHTAAEAAVLTEGAFASFLTARNAGRSIIHFDRQIDHIVPLGTFEEIQPRTFRIHNKEGLRDPEAWRRTYSDHFAVTAELAAVPDDDPQAKLSQQGKRLR
jgi:endonuclease/exonuclease/phosphatase family metal-dependent hydrolase